MRLIARPLAIALLATPSLHAMAAQAALPGLHRTVLFRSAPTYPELARRMHIGGPVVLILQVEPTGAVSAARVVSGHALLRDAAEEAARHWKFAPGPAALVTVAVTFTPPAS